MYDLMRGADPKKVAINVAAGFLDNFSPVGNPLANDGSLQPQELTPFEPMRDWMRHHMNRNSFGAPILPENDSDKKKPDHLREWRSSKGSAYEAAANWMNAASGGTKTRAGNVDISPETLKFIVSTLGGGTARFAFDMLHLGNLGVHAVTDEGAEGLTPDIREIPIVRGVAAEENIQWSRQAFNAKAREATDALDAFKLAIKQHDKAAVSETTGRDKALMGLAGAVKSFRGAVTALRDRQDAINADETHSLGWKRMQLRDLEAREAELYERFFGVWNRKMKPAEAGPTARP
jgi:hypothetical protein